MITGPYAKNLIFEIGVLINQMKKHEQDLMISVFGMEGSGKSRWAMNLAVLLDNNFNASTLRQKTAQTINDFGRVAPKTKSFEVCWWDEAHRFSKRGTYDAEENRDLLEYFQDIRGGKKIFILCYPDKEEIDKKVLKRSRLFFETVKQGDKFMVKAWSRIQIEKMIRELRLPSPETRKKLWIGTSPHPKAIYYHDSEKIEAIIEEYAKFKQGSVELTDQKLAEKYGYRNPTQMSISTRQELIFEGVSNPPENRWIRDLIVNKLIEKESEYTPLQVRQEAREWKVFDESVDKVICNLVKNDIKQSKMILDKIKINVVTDYNVNILDNTDKNQKQEMVLA